MDRLSIEVIKGTNLYLRTGGKKNRQEQVKNMERFVAWIKTHHPEVTSLGQLGRKHIAHFWRYNASCSKTYKRNYFYAIRYIWQQILHRNSEPPHYNKMTP
ncbi:hypothetical protein [Vibrio sp. 1CM24A]|uniref:hypothetical protein n=1 Tax=Vibrio sp. 1CM24A TaxID=2929165 RepID=UPI0020BDAA59|nr:hypothetical protein [Vibrio sp. 1CM24A]MCK8083545.1 hypothetical protein [Vibrio sp. 1CM24A]CAK1869464.1 conserved hypothetical protein [Vibrio crassostreae]